MMRIMNIGGLLTVGSNIVPSSTEITLGTSAAPFKEIFVSANSVFEDISMNNN